MVKYPYIANMSNKDIQEEKYVVISREAYEKLLSEHENIKMQLAELKRMIFGRKSEKMSIIPLGQLSLFDIDFKEEQT